MMPTPDDPGLAEERQQTRTFAPPDEVDKFRTRTPTSEDQPDFVHAVDAHTATVLSPSAPRLLTESAPGDGERWQQRPDLPGYEVLDVLGEGGMGIVYKAVQVQANRVVALKVMLDQLRSSAMERARFRTEAEAQARLQHPNIVPIYEVGEQDGMLYFTMEYCAGGSLYRRLAGKPLPPGEAAGLVEVLARAVHAAHQANVIHRDLKPLNILLPEGPEVPLGACTPKLTDFGLARKLDAATHHTRPGQPMGSPPYMPPEQVQGNLHAIGPGTDIYALGAILYELLTGRAPFVGTTLLELYRHILQEDPVPVRRLLPSTPTDLETICQKCLEKAPKKRYLTAEALAEDLRRFRAGEPITARPVGRLERAAKWCRRRPTAAALLAVLLLVMAGVAVAVPLIIAGLHTTRLQALADAEQAHAESDQLAERLRVEKRRSEVRSTAEQQLREGQQALDRGDLEKAQALFGLVRAGAPELDADLREAAISSLRDLDRSVWNRRAYQSLPRHRDRAMFLLYRDVFSDLDRPDLEEAAVAARRALQPFGLPERVPEVEKLSGLTAEQRRQIREWLYEVCLLLAEAIARPRPGEAAEAGKKRAQDALELLKKAAGVYPEGKPWRRVLYLKWAGDQDAADGEQARGDRQPTSAVDWFFKGCTHAIDERDLDQAILSFDRALQLRQDLFWAHFFRAHAYTQNGKDGEARAGFTVCGYLQPQFVWIYLFRGFVCGRSRDFEAARADFERAEKDLDKDAGNRSASYVLRVNRGFVAVQRGDNVAAVKDLEQAVAIWEQGYHAHVNLGIAYERCGKLIDAATNLERAIALQPTLAEPCRLRANLADRQGDPNMALAFFDRALRREQKAERPNTAKIASDQRERALLLVKLQRYPEALAASEESLRLRHDPSTHFVHGVVLLGLGEWQKALDALQEVPAGQRTAAYYAHRARAHSGLKEYAKAAEDCTRGMESDPSAEMLIFRGSAYLGGNAFDMALADFTEVLRRDNRNSEAYACRALTLAAMRDYSRAKKDAETAVKLDPGTPIRSLQAASVYAAAAVQPDAGDDKQADQDRAVILAYKAVLHSKETQRKDLWERLRRDPNLWPLLKRGRLDTIERLLELPNRRTKPANP
jgi:tetratricopeptide (TPR) repeat protein